MRIERHRLLGDGPPEPAPDPLATPQTLDELAVRYLLVKAATLAPKTIATTDAAYRARVAPALADVTLDRVDRARVEGWLATLIAAGASRRQVVGPSLRFG